MPIGTTQKIQLIITGTVGLLKKIFNIFYNSQPSLKLRESAAMRIDRRLAPVLTKIDELQQHLTRMSQEHNNLVSKQHRQVTSNLENVHTNLDDRIVRAIQIGQFSDWRLKVIGERQEAIANINCSIGMLDDFSKVMDIIFTNESDYNPDYNSLLLLDLIRAYMYEEGVWMLRQEINDFLAIPQKHSPKNAQLPAIPSNRPLRILVISGLFPAIEHGGGLRLFDILQGLSAEHEIDLYSVYKENSDQYSLNLLKNKLGATRLIESEQIIDHNFVRDDISSWLAETGHDDSYYDIIQLEYPHTIFLTNFMKQYGRKVGFTFMECLTKSNVIKIQDMQVSNRLKEMPRFSSELWQFAVEEKFVLENADFLIAVTPEDADFLARLYPRRPQIIPTCISQHEIIDRIAQSKITQKKGLVAFLGFFGHYPNIDSMKWYLDKIHQIVKEKVPQYKFLIIGAGDTSTLQKMVKNDEYVEFTGRVDDVIPHIQRASVCTLPLITGAGIRGKLNQYSICGRPSVSTSIGNKGLSYKHEESVMIADTATDFATAIITLLTDEESNRGIAEQAKAHAEANFTWGKHLEDLVNIYRNTTA